MILHHPKKEEAINYLLDKTPPETLGEIYHLMTSEGSKDWPTQQHFGLGLWVRNTLRQKFERDDQTLDSKWASLIETAAKRVMPGQSTGPKGSERLSE